MTGVDEHIEVEIKFDAAEDIGLPDLSEIPGVASIGKPLEQHLSATYFDTPDLRLARHGITLRRRTGGADDGWHLKHPKVGDARVEVHRPLGRSTRTPPRALADLVRVHVRDTRLVSAATLTTHRLATPLLDGRGAVLAEVADDRVEGQVAGVASPVTWREIEVELVGGSRTILMAVGDRLRQAGAVPGSSSSKLARVLRTVGAPGPWVNHDEPETRSDAGSILRAHLTEQVAALVRRDPLARIDAPDAVHKMRVATRRLRSALATFRPLLDRESIEPVRDELRWLGQVLGGPRDEEVMHARLLELLAAEPPELVLGPVRRRVDIELRARHRTKHRQLVAELDGPRYFRLLDELDALALRPPLTGQAAEPAVDVLPSLVARTRRRLLGLAAEADAAATADARAVALHDVRKAAKRSRYAGEAVAPVFGAKATRFAAEMERLQEVLGEQQDSLVTRGVLRELGVQAHLAGENGFAFGRLHGLEVGRAERAEAGYADALAAVAGKPPRWLR